MKKKIFIISMLLLPLAVINYAQNTWKQKADFAGDARTGTVGFAIGSKGYIGTGFNNFTYVKDFWEYDPLTDKWTRKADFGGNARVGATGFSIGNKAYIGTGSFFGGTYVIYKDFWEYDPATDKWTQKADLPGDARVGAVGFSIGTKGYIGTGWNGTSETKDFWEYDPATDKWTQKADFGGEARDGAIGFSIGNKGYIGSGFNTDFWEYDPATDKWTRKADVPGDIRTSATGFSIGTKGYFGAGVAGISYKDFWQYDPETNKWIRKTDFGGFATGGAVGFSISGKGYMGLGINYTKDFWEYTPGKNACTASTDLKVTNVTDTSAKLKWTPPYTAFSGSQVVYRAVNATEWLRQLKPSVADHIILEGLLPNTTYRWAIRSLCGKDSSTSDWATGPDFTTTSSFTELPATINISPNPVTGNQLNLHFANSKATNLQLTISDLQGKVYINQKLVVSNGVFNKSINIAVLHKGIYILKLISNNYEQQQIKFVKTN